MTGFPATSSAASRFVVIGDAGTGDAAQYAVARQMARWQATTPFSTVLVLGDNVYQDGEPQYFYDRIYRPYQDLVAQGVQFRPVLGNHDVRKGFGNLQLAYWGVPRHYSFKLGPKGAEVECFAVDTTLMAPNSVDGDSYAPNSPLSKQRANQQWAWLQNALATSTASMKVVYGHYPMYSEGAASGKYKRASTQVQLEQRLAPLLQQYGVDAYMAGHEHHYEKPKNVNGTYYLVSGAGGKLDTPYRGGQEGNGLMKKLHFMLFDITPQGLAYRTISEQGQLLDAGLIPRKQANLSTRPFIHGNFYNLVAGIQTFQKAFAPPNYPPVPALPPPRFSVSA